METSRFTGIGRLSQSFGRPGPARPTHHGLARFLTFPLALSLLFLLVAASFSWPAHAATSAKSSQGRAKPSGVSKRPASSGTAYGSETREAVFREKISTPSGKKGVENPDTRETELKIVFPVDGGRMSGYCSLNLGSDYEPNDLGLGRMIIKLKWNFEGSFSGGDGGSVTGTMASADDGEVSDSPVTGRLWANGTGEIKWDKKTYKITYPPFAGECCVKDPQFYKLWEGFNLFLIRELVKAASPVVHAKLVKFLKLHVKAGLELTQFLKRGAKAAAWNLANRVAPIEMRYPDAAPRPDFLDGLEKAFDDSCRAADAAPRAGFLYSMIENMDKALGVMEIGTAVYDADYKSAAILAAIEAVGAYSNMAGIAIVLGQAAQADWESFCEGVYESQFRKFYGRVYCAGGAKPSEKVARMGQAGRLKDYMEECIDWLDPVGGQQVSEFRKMLIDFAYYKLGLKKSRDDFQVITKKGRQVISNRSDVTVLAALFQAYEQIFFYEIEAERARKLAIRKGKELKQALRDASEAMRLAEKGDFSMVWTKYDFGKVFCTIFHRLVKEGKLKPPADKKN